MSQSYELLNPILVGPVTLKNRIALAPMVVMLASPDGALTKRSMDYYVRYARGGVGLIIVEGTVRDEKEGKGVPSGFAIHNIGYVTGFNKIVKLVKDQGASIVLQIAIIGQGDLGWDSEEVRKQR